MSDPDVGCLCRYRLGKVFSVTSLLIAFSLHKNTLSLGFTLYYTNHSFSTLHKKSLARSKKLNPSLRIKTLIPSSPYGRRFSISPPTSLFVRRKKHFLYIFFYQYFTILFHLPPNRKVLISILFFFVELLFWKWLWFVERERYAVRSKKELLRK